MMESDTTELPSDPGASSGLACPQCSAESVTTYRHSDSFNYGSDASAVTLRVELPVRRCTACDFEFLDHGAEKLRHAAVCRHLGVLSPQEIRDVRKRYGMTRAEFAQASGLGEASLSRWENGVVVQNLANDRYLRLLAIPGVMSRLHELLTPGPAPAHVRGLATPQRFRALNVTPQVRDRKETFQLRLAS